MYNIPYHNIDITNKSFLVTGGCGFIGSHLTEYLLQHQAGKVRVLDDLSTGFRSNIEPFLKNKNFEFIEGDICNEKTCQQACQGIDYVLHQAALGSVTRSLLFPLATHRVNVTGFMNILLAARDAGVSRIVYASSSSVYGDNTELPKKEDNTGNPLSPYAVSKKSDELYARVFSLNYGMKIIGLRYFNIFGPRQNPNGPYAAVIPLFMEAAIKKTRPVIFGDGNQSRDFTFIENAVQANIKALFSEEKSINKVYNVATGKNISVNKIFEEIKNLSKSAASPEYKEERKGEIRDSLADISRAKELLDYKPTVHFTEGLKTTWNWFTH